MMLNGAIMQLVEMRENSMMPEVFKPYFDKVIETISECEEPPAQPEKRYLRLIDVDNLIDDCKRYLATLNPDRDGKECTRIHWLIGVLNNAPSVNPDTSTDCISRQAAIDAIVQYLGRINRDFDNWKGTARIILDHVPSAQPEIVHCRDCKHRGEKPIADGRYWCEIHDTFMYYCSDAERRTDDKQGCN